VDAQNGALRDLFLSQQNSPHTRISYERGLSVFRQATGDKPYDQIRDTDLIAWKETLDPLAISSRYTRWTAVRSMFDWLMKSGRINRNPFATVKPPEKAKGITPRIPTNATFHAIAMMDPSECMDERDWRDRAIFRLLGTGLRVSEITNIKDEDFFHVEEYDQWVLRVFGKGNKERLVPLSQTAQNALHDWLRVRVGSGAIFGAMTVRQVQSALERRCDRLGVKRINAHSLRHHYATRLIRSGADVFTVQKLLGHASVATTQVYVNLDMTDMIKATNNDPVG